MAVDEDGDWPEEGDLLICTVKDIKQNGAYLTLDGYDGQEGFVFVGEIAAGWVKNIRAHVREGQRVVAKVIQVKKDRKRVELSLKSVSEERRRETVQSWKNEERANQIMRVASERIGWDEEKTSTVSGEMIEAFGTLYGALEECAISENALSDSGFEGDWIAPFIEMAVKNIIPDTVEIRGKFLINVDHADGIEVIRKALLAAENISDEESELIVTCHYDGAPSYRIDLKAPDFKTAEDGWTNATQACIEIVQSSGGSAEAERE